MFESVTVFKFQRCLPFASLARPCLFAPPLPARAFHSLSHYTSVRWEYILYDPFFGRCLLTMSSTFRLLLYPVRSVTDRGGGSM